MVENKSDFPYKKKVNKKNINIRININNNDSNKMYYKIKNKPLTSSTSGKQNLLKRDKIGNINSTDRKYKKLLINKKKNNSVQYKYDDSINDKNINFKFTECNSSLEKDKSKNKNKKKEFILKKKKYGEIIIENNNFKKKSKTKPNIESIHNLKEKSTKNKNKNNIIIYNNLLKNGGNRSSKDYEIIKKHKINNSISTNKTLDKMHINHFILQKKKNIGNSKSNNNISNLTKRKSYRVPSIKVKKRTKEEKEDKKRNENNIFIEENKHIFMSNLIENKQIEYLKDYEKHKIDSKDKLIKNNEKKIKAINDKKLIDKIMSSDEDNNDEEIKIKKDKNLTINYINENKTNNKYYIIKKNKSIEQNTHKNKNFKSKDNNYNIIKKNNENLKINIKEKRRSSIGEENKNNYNDTDIYINTLNNNANPDKIIMYNLRKPKINTLEYIYRINNNLDVNKLITSISCLDFKNNEINNNENNDQINENAPESNSSVNILSEKKNVRRKEEINDFIKIHRLKIKNKEIRLKKEQKDKILKKFKNFLELQKNIKGNSKLKFNTLNYRHNAINKTSNNDNFIKKTMEEFKISPISENTSMSSSFNQQEFYLSIYDAQRIYTSNENDRFLLKNHSVIIDKELDRNFKQKNNNKNFKYITINRKKNIINHKLIKNSEIKKLDKNAIKAIKSVIIRLNNFLKDNSIINKKKVNYIKNKKYLKNNYDYILENAKRLIKEKHKNSIKSNPKKSKNKKNDFLISIRHIPSGDKNYKKITMNEMKKITNNSNNNINLKIDKKNDLNIKNINFSYKMKKFSKHLGKNHYSLAHNKKKKLYNFTIEQLNKYREIFNYIFIYLKLFIQKNIFNLIITFVNLKYKYISGFHQLIFFIKKKPFNYLRIIQQREYYQVILRQFYLPYLSRAFNNIKFYVINQQKYSDIDNIIKQVYFSVFLKRMVFYIQKKENYQIEDDRIIFEEKEEFSYESSSKNGNRFNILSNNNINKEQNESNKNLYNVESYINNMNQKINEKRELLYKDANLNKYKKEQKNISNDSNSINEKENSEYINEIKPLGNIINIIINRISLSHKIYIFNLFKKYYLESIIKNKKIIEENKNLKNYNNTEIKEDSNNDNSKNEDIRYNTYIYESLTDKSSITVFPNSEGSDRLHRIYNYIEQNQNINYNEDIPSNENNNNEYNNIFNNINKKIKNEDEEIIDYKYKIQNEVAKEEKNENEKKNSLSNLPNKDNKKEEIVICINNKVKNNQKDINNQIQGINYNNDNIFKNNNSKENNLSDNKKNEQNINNNNQKERIKNKEIEENSVNSKENYNSNLINLIDNDSNNKNNYSEKETNIRTKKSDIIKMFEFKVDEKFDKILEYKGKKIINIPTEIEQKLTEDLTNEIINQLFKEEIEIRKNILSNKKNIKHNSNNSINGSISKESISIISNSPGRKNNKSNFCKYLVSNNCENYQSVNSIINNNNNNNNIQEEESFNTSIFMKTIYEVKKDKELNFYEENIFPNFLSIIEKNINKNYLNIINNLKQPLKKDNEEVMNDLSDLITFETINNNNLINYKSDFYNKDIIKKEYIDKKILYDFNEKLKKKSLLYKKYYYEYINKCIYDSTNELIKEKRLYRNIGEPLLWSLRNRKIEYFYKDTKLFKDLFTSNIINELKNLFSSKIGAIIENNENLNISQFSKERDIKFNENIKEELKKDNEFEQLDEQETIVKLMISKIIMNQLLNEVIEILEHIQNSRKQPEKYNNKSIFSCDNIPLLNFQNNNKKEEYDEEEEEDEKSEDRINQ